MSGTNETIVKTVVWPCRVSAHLRRMMAVV
jgi:hypothetical protein